MIYSKNEIYNDQTHKGVELGLGFLFWGENWCFFQHQPQGSPLRKFPLPNSPDFLCGNFRLGFRLPPLFEKSFQSVTA